MSKLSGAVWRKSNRSGGNGGNCVEVALTPDVVGVRDSKNRTGPVLTVSPDAWREFVAEVKAGTHDIR